MEISDIGKALLQPSAYVEKNNIQRIQPVSLNNYSIGTDTIETSEKKVSSDIFADGVNAKSNSDDPPGWNEFLEKTKKIDKYASVPDPDTLTERETLSDSQSISLKNAVILVPENMSPGLKISVDELKTYIEKVTGKSVKTLPLDKADLSQIKDPDTSIIAVGNGKSVDGLVPPPTGNAEGYSIQTNKVKVNGVELNIVGVNGDDMNGQQYGVSRLMELSGKRFFNYMDEYTPPVGKGLLPANGFSETHNPNDQMKVRGFAPHTYHPIPLSIAFHEPGQEHLEMMKKYIDWLAQNGQNFIMFPMLELDKKNNFIPIKDSSQEKFKEWLPYAKEIVDYAHQRGVKVSVKLAFANFVSANTYAVNPVQALWQSHELDSKYKKVKNSEKDIEDINKNITELNKRISTATPAQLPDLQKQLNTEKGKLNKLTKDIEDKKTDYNQLLNKYTQEDQKKIDHVIDDFMNVSWDEITWNLGTSEFSATNDDLTINWMNGAADYIKNKYPGVKTSVRSHIPSRPFSEKYNESYFQLVRFTDPSIGNYVHTVEAYSMVDKAPVYGNQNFEDKLKYLFRSTKERSDVYYPETSYWVAYDVSVPLFLPVYMLNRKHDTDIIKNVPNLDGQIGFTTAWEWGYWLNDYAQARMQVKPEESLTQIIDGAFTVFGDAKNDMTRVLIDSMKEQQKFLVDKNLIRYMSGFSSLTDFGAMIKDIPILNKYVEGSNSSPVRLKPSTIMKWDKDEIQKYENGDLKDLKDMVDSFESLDKRIKAIKANIPESSDRYYSEIADGLEINYLRAKQEYSLMQATVDARKAELYHDDSFKKHGERFLKQADESVDGAVEVIGRREKMYRDKPEYTYAEGKAPTMWQNRYLTPVHTAEYWKNSQKEVDKLYNHKNIFQEWFDNHKAKKSVTVGPTISVPE